jgi:hypothetical protein
MAVSAFVIAVHLRLPKMEKPRVPLLDYSNEQSKPG